MCCRFRNTTEKQKSKNNSSNHIRFLISHLIIIVKLFLNLVNKCFLNLIKFKLNRYLFLIINQQDWSIIYIQI
jgi:hypothetical protein